MRSGLMVAREHPNAVLAILFAAAVAMWVYFGLTRTVNQDEVISVLAARGILEHGFQILPSGYSYHRGYVPHYLLAGVIGLLGEGDFSVMVPGLVLAVGSLWLVFLLARDLTGKAWVGVVTVALLLSVQLETMYATSPRFYMALQFFTLLASYSAWRGYVRGDVGFRFIAFLSIAAAILTHREGVALAIAIPVSVVLVRKMTARPLSPLLTPWTMVGAGFVVASAVFMLAYSPPNPMPLIVGYSPYEPGLFSVLALDTSLMDWARDLLEPKRALLYAASITPLLFFVITAIGRRTWRVADPAVIYIGFIATVSVLGLMMAFNKTDARLWFFVLPLYGLLAVTGAAEAVKVLGLEQRPWLGQHWAKASVLVLVAAGAVAIIGVGWNSSGRGIIDIAANAFGPRCVQPECDKGIKAFHENLSAMTNPDDLIVSGDPFVTNFYLGRVDRYLKEKVIYRGDRDVPFQDWLKTDEVVWYDSLSDEYFGIPLVDADDLDDLLHAQTRVVIVTDSTILWRSTEETKALIESRFHELYAHGDTTAYVNCLEAPCGPDASN